MVDVKEIGGSVWTSMGIPDEFSVYINKKDYTAHTVSWSLTKKLNEITTFKASLLGIDDDEKLDVAKGEDINILFDDGIIMQGSIERVTYTTDYKTEVEGYGDEGKMLKKIIPVCCELYTDYKTAIYHICSENGDGIEPFYLTPAPNIEDLGIVIATIKYKSKLEAISDLCKVTGREWWVETDYDTWISYLYMAYFKGSEDSVITFTADGTAPNCTVISYKQDIENLCNSVYYTGTINSVETTARITDSYRVTGLNWGDKYTGLTVDSNLYEAMDDSQTIMKCKKSARTANARFEGRYVSIGSDEVALVSSFIDMGDYYQYEIVRDVLPGYPASTHPIRTEVCLAAGGPGADAYVIVSGSDEDLAALPAVGVLKIGSQDYIISSTTTTEEDEEGNMVGLIKMESRGYLDESLYTELPFSPEITGLPYKHSEGSLIFYWYDMAVAIYNPTHPYSGSSVALDGLSEKWYSDTSIDTLDGLDQAAYSKLNTETMKTITIEVCDPYEIFPLIRIGDVVSFNDSETTLTGDYRVLGYTLGMDQGQISLKYTISQNYVTCIDDLAKTTKDVKNLTLH
ncbi:MAG: hypothetical protein WC444_05610 [Candidatus Paceibacterota bacterium]